MITTNRTNGGPTLVRNSHQNVAEVLRKTLNPARSNPKQSKSASRVTPRKRRAFAAEPFISRFQTHSRRPHVRSRCELYLDGSLAKHVVLPVAQGLARGDDDGVAGVHAKWIEVLSQRGKRGEKENRGRRTKSARVEHITRKPMPGSKTGFHVKGQDGHRYR